jgi:hypothetical protein
VFSLDVDVDVDMCGYVWIIMCGYVWMCLGVLGDVCTLGCSVILHAMCVQIGLAFWVVFLVGHPRVTMASVQLASTFDDVLVLDYVRLW